MAPRTSPQVTCRLPLLHGCRAEAGWGAGSFTRPFRWRCGLRAVAVVLLCHLLVILMRFLALAACQRRGRRPSHWLHGSH
ncbi:hypothetical protein BDZ89DRAFT_1067271 [Hymenopellis radicata]|nr:hypothetical protein BDZ89DRAFT_1067271 [Hymenopellis radicata]